MCSGLKWVKEGVEFSQKSRLPISRLNCTIAEWRKTPRVSIRDTDMNYARVLVVETALRTYPEEQEERKKNTQPRTYEFSAQELSKLVEIPGSFVNECL